MTVAGTQTVVGRAWFRRLHASPHGTSAATRPAWTRRVSAAEIVPQTVPNCRWCNSTATLNNASESPYVESLRLDAIEDGLPDDIRATVCDGCGNVALVGPPRSQRPRRSALCASARPALRLA